MRQRNYYKELKKCEKGSCLEVCFQREPLLSLNIHLEPVVYAVHGGWHGIIEREDLFHFSFVVKWISDFWFIRTVFLKQIQ